ncbi:MAG: efflux RND transporter periplasmic adaptor subunit [Proteobacteria bacterium]|nr:efflux RND transporter periplasmic adaptor subunit [Pseudomonadota bacterium]
MGLALGTWACGSGEAALETDGGPPPVTVEVVQVQPELLRDEVALTGTLEAEHRVLLKPEGEGVVRRIGFEEGQSVAAGDVLVELGDAEQQARLQEALAEQKLARDVSERTRTLTNRDISSVARRAEAEAELDKASARVALARLELERTRVRAPFDGLAGARLVSPGDRVEEGDGLVEVLSVERLQLVFAVNEQGVALAKTGVPVHVRVAAWPNERFPGEVFFVAPGLDPAARRLILKAWIANQDGRLKPGMFANVDVEIARREAALLVPEAALVYDRNGAYVWRVDGGVDGPQAVKVPVRIGVRQRGRVEVVTGLRAGDRVVATGTHKVLAGSRIEIVADPVPAAVGEVRKGDDGEET